MIVLKWNYFLGGGIPSFFENNYQECEEFVRSFPSSSRLVPHNVSGIPATLWLTMWTECEEFVSLNEDAYFQHFATLLTLSSDNKGLHLSSQTLHIPSTL